MHTSFASLQFTFFPSVCHCVASRQFFFSEFVCNPPQMKYTFHIVNRIPLYY